MSKGNSKGDVQPCALDELEAKSVGGINRHQVSDAINLHHRGSGVGVPSSSPQQLQNDLVTRNTNSGTRLPYTGSGTQGWVRPTVEM